MPPHDTQTLPQDTAFDLLSNARRRFVLRRLQASDGPVELSDLAEELAAEENDVPSDELSAQQRKRTYVSLYQTHVPKLDEAGVVDYDSETGMIHATPHVAELARYFGEEGRSVPWGILYAVVAGAGLLLSVLSLEVLPLNPLTVGVAALVAVLLLSVVHYAYERVIDTPGAPIPVGEK